VFFSKTAYLKVENLARKAYRAAKTAMKVFYKMKYDLLLKIVAWNNINHFIKISTKSFKILKKVILGKNLKSKQKLDYLYSVSLSELV
jgi:hypothetical protein